MFSPKTKVSNQTGFFFAEAKTVQDLIRFSTLLYPSIKRMDPGPVAPGESPCAQTDIYAQTDVPRKARDDKNLKLKLKPTISELK